MILVTGGLGFLGSHIVLSLIAQGQEVVIVDNLSTSNIQILDRLQYITQRYVPFTKVDIRNTPALIRVFEQYSVDTVIHAAGFKSIEESILKPLEYYNANVSCILSLLRAMQQTGIRNLVYLSSLQIYAESSLTLTETTPFEYRYDNPYIKSQQMIEQIMTDTFATDSEWNMVSLRLGNVAGAFEHTVLGEMVNPLPKSIVPLMMQAAMGIREVIEIRTKKNDIAQSLQRSFVHVLDVCHAVHRTLAWLTQQTHALAFFNIAGEVISIAELVEITEQVTKKSIKTIVVPCGFQEIEQVGSASQKAKDILGWYAQHSIEKMIEDQWWFYSQNLNIN
ncbi:MULTISPECIES: NAD-dependent epimerase/dehydratase family protein [unclassified Acinetobacter]|uniref:NAD-dependent epimerase/dehydratase family protein n=1 Tax=unclassified Acinetobacter TaxID=196816 RepID=UPI0029344A4E|nr:MULTISPECIES: NAD-dependent epimerase/dehydratase family protein [unclassified Acinetobacter]WOE32096.1 NAD-dependent epimerase/dehydratase family protein [Acinetobacter sp. SAAs470]WOE37565.1 NAD-dependent epimerase/dehydratase family protein [Acinetobacter sp. SAAs474]